MGNMRMVRFPMYFEVYEKKINLNGKLNGNKTNI